tara:strand:+ start:1112 stop:1243 length:132 start_codon:yes stop_codon:yes gene_type:complete
MRSIILTLQHQKRLPFHAERNFLSCLLKGLIDKLQKLSNFMIG